MKTEENISVKPKRLRFAFVLVCLLISGGGRGAKTEVDRIGKMQDELLNNFLQPAPVPLAGRQRTAVATPKLPASAETAPNSPDRPRVSVNH